MINRKWRNSEKEVHKKNGWMILLTRAKSPPSRRCCGCYSDFRCRWRCRWRCQCRCCGRCCCSCRDTSFPYKSSKNQWHRQQALESSANLEVNFDLKIIISSSTVIFKKKKAKNRMTEKLLLALVVLGLSCHSLWAFRFFPDSSEGKSWSLPNDNNNCSNNKTDNDNNNNNNNDNETSMTTTTTLIYCP